MRRGSGAWVLLVCACTSLAAGAGDARLIDAVKSGNRPLVRELLRARAAVNAPETDGTTPLHWAVRASDLETVQLLLKAGANAKAANRYGVTPLSLAATNGDAAAIEALLKAGADANAALPEGETALMTAARTGKAVAVKALLARGAVVNAAERWQGETALMWAAAEDHPEVVKLLIEHGADVDARSSVLQFPKYTYNASTMVTQPLPKGGMTALLMAARAGALEGARALIAAGANLNLTDPEGTSPLVMAIINRHNDVAALLIEKGADPNVADVTGMTALYAAVDLRELGSLINRPTPKPSSILDNIELVKMLLARGANPNLRQRLPILPRFHNSGDKQLAEGATPLMRAAKSVDVPVMRLLLEHGADPNLTTRSYTSALMFATGGRNRGTEQDLMDAITLCLDHGADVNAFDINGSTALFMAIPRGENVVKLLVARGAELDVRDKQGRTPLDVALAAPTGRGSAEGGGGRGGGRGGRGTADLLRELMDRAAPRQ